MKPIIVTDLDGTLVNLVDEVLTGIFRKFNIALHPGDCIDYDVAKSFLPHLEDHFEDVAALDKYLSREVWTNPEAYENARPYWDLHQALQQVLAKGACHSLLALTSRPADREVQDSTLSWLHDWHYDAIECYFAATYGGGKLEVIEALIEEKSGTGSEDPPIMVIEDDIATAKLIAENFADEKVEVFMVDRPWTDEYWQKSGGALKRRYVLQELDYLCESGNEG